MKLLLPFAWLYAVPITLRNTLFDWGVLKQRAVNVPVISVGNLTVGGTGKTPLVEYIVRYLLALGRRVGVVSRGYKRRSKGVVVVSDGREIRVDARDAGDEPMQIASAFPQAIVVVGERRFDAAQEAVRLGAEVIVVDDGFQHRYLKRDLNIVVVDSTNDVTTEALLPAGKLREPLAGLRRADLVAFSHADEGTPDVLEPKLRKFFRGEFIRFCYRIRDVRRAKDDAVVSLDAVRAMRLVGFSGIGNHEAFIRQLNKERFMVVSDLRFADHHRYGDVDLSVMEYAVSAMHADAVITTEKDIVRLRAEKDIAQKLFDHHVVFYVGIDVEILGGKDILHACITQTLRGNA